MPTATLSSKSQLVLPAQVRRQLGIKAGDRQSSQASPDDNNGLSRTTPSNPRLTAAVQLRYRQMQSGHS